MGTGGDRWPCVRTRPSSLWPFKMVLSSASELPSMPGLISTLLNPPGWVILHKSQEFSVHATLSSLVLLSASCGLLGLPES